jgi:hypothetical protein
LLRFPPPFLSSQVSSRSEPSMNAGFPFVWYFANGSARAPKIVMSTKVGSSFHSPLAPSLKPAVHGEAELADRHVVRRVAQLGVPRQVPHEDHLVVARHRRRSSRFRGPSGRV